MSMYFGEKDKDESDVAHINLDQECPLCGYVMDAVTCLTDKPETSPSEGDTTICASCICPLVFGEGLKLRKPSKLEQRLFDTDTAFQKILAVMRRVKHEAGS